MKCGCEEEYRCPDCGHCFACEHRFLYRVFHRNWGEPFWDVVHPVPVGWYDWSIRGFRYFFDTSPAYKYSPHFETEV